MPNIRANLITKHDIDVQVALRGPLPSLYGGKCLSNHEIKHFVKAHIVDMQDIHVDKTHPRIIGIANKKHALSTTIWGDPEEVLDAHGIMSIFYIMTTGKNGWAEPFPILFSPQDGWYGIFPLTAVQKKASAHNIIADGLRNDEFLELEFDPEDERRIAREVKSTQKDHILTMSMLHNNRAIQDVLDRRRATRDLSELKAAF